MTDDPRLHERTADGQREVWLEASLSNGWEVSYLLKHRSGRVEIAELRVHPVAGPDSAPGEWSRQLADVPTGGLTARRMREVLLTKHLGQISDLNREVARVQGEEARWRRFAGSLPELADAHHPGRRGRSDHFLASVAARYAGMVEDGSHAPMKELANELASRGQPFSVATVRGFIHEARRRELLTPATRGKAGGDITSKAEQLLGDAGRARIRVASIGPAGRGQRRRGETQGEVVT